MGNELRMKGIILDHEALIGVRVDRLVLDQIQNQPTIMTRFLHARNLEIRHSGPIHLEGNRDDAMALETLWIADTETVRLPTTIHAMLTCFCGSRIAMPLEQPLFMFEGDLVLAQVPLGCLNRATIMVSGTTYLDSDLYQRRRETNIICEAFSDIGPVSKEEDLEHFRLKTAA